jgi:hypothetical protein
MTDLQKTPLGKTKKRLSAGIVNVAVVLPKSFQRKLQACCFGVFAVTAFR